MDIDRVSFESLANGGDDVTGALVKLDHNVQELADAITDGDTAATELTTRVTAVEDKATDLDTRVTAAKTAADNASSAAGAAKTVADAALPKSGGTLTGPLTGTTGTFSGAVVTGAARTVGMHTVDPLNGGTLGTAGGSGSRLLTWQCNSGNSDRIILDAYRGSSGSSWANMDYTLYRYVDVTNVSHIAFTGAGRIAFGTGGSNRWEVSDAAFVPTADLGYDLGASNRRLRQIYAASSTISTSDEEAKTDIGDSELGLEYILALRPVRYRLKVSGNQVEKVVVGQRTETVVVGHRLEPQVVGRITLADGTEKDVTADVPVDVTEDVTVDVTEDRVTTIAGVRYHEGFLAGEVADALRSVGVDPATCGIWTRADPNDPESLQGLRYEENIPALVNSVRTLKEMIDQLTERLNALSSQNPPDAAVTP